MTPQPTPTEALQEIASLPFGELREQGRSVGDIAIGIAKRALPEPVPPPEFSDRGKTERSPRESSELEPEGESPELRERFELNVADRIISVATRASAGQVWLGEPLAEAKRAIADAAFELVRDEVEQAGHAQIEFERDTFEGALTAVAESRWHKGSVDPYMDVQEYARRALVDGRAREKG